jgi:tetratricopeptide (TPR) repeat protein
MSSLNIGSYSYDSMAIASDALGPLFEGIETNSEQPVYLKALSGSQAEDSVDRPILRWQTVKHSSLLLPKETLSDHGTTWAILLNPGGVLLHCCLPDLLQKGIQGRHRLLSAIVDVCKAVEALHALGIVHGQINPTSVMVGCSEYPPQGWLLFCDRFSPRIAGDYIAATDCLPYIPQEQLRGGGSFQADIYALSMLVHMSFGMRRLEENASGYEHAKLIIWGEVLPFTANLDGLGPEAANALRMDLETLAAVTTKGLQRNPDSRYLTVGELRQALDELCRRMAPFALGQRLHRERRFVEAAVIFEEATSGPQSALAQVFLGRTIGLELGDYDAGIVSFRRALKSDPGLESARLGLAEIYLRQARYSMAKREYEEMLATRPDDSQLLMGYANVLHSSGNLEGALNILRKIQARNPYYLPSYISAIRIGLKSGFIKNAERDSNEAIKRIAEVVKLGNFNPDELAEIYYLRAVVLETMGAHENASRWAEKALGLTPLHVESHKLLVEIYGSMGHLDEAMEHLAILLQIKPDQEGIVAALGRLMNGDSGQSEDAN